MIQWLSVGYYAAIEGHIEQETTAFVEFYEWLCVRMPGVLGEWQSERHVRPEISQPHVVQLEMNNRLLLE